MNKLVQENEEAFTNAKNAAEELKNTINGYDSAVDKLSDLKKGTKEYEEALKEANAAAEELIEKYGLFDQYEVKDGVITFKDGALDKLQAEQDAETAGAKSKLYASKIMQSEAQQNYDSLKLSQDMGEVGGVQKLLNYVNNFNDEA